MLACCLGCVLSLFIPVPCVILASGVFLSGWLLGPLSGLTPGGFPSWLIALVGSCPPSLCVRLAVSRLCISLPPPCALFSYWGQVFHLVVRAFLACSLFTDWVFYPFSFSQASFVSFFLIQIPRLCCAFGGACQGVSFPRGPPSLAGVSVSRSWGVLVLLILFQVS